MSTVYVIGAGASRGESLSTITNLPAGIPALHTHPPPVTDGFFDRDLLNALGYPEAEQDFADVVGYIRGARLLVDAFGDGSWKTIDLEEVFTSLEVEREFHNPESDEGARLLLLGNKLIRYIRRIIGLCTQYTYGEYYRKLAMKLDINDSIVTFNWDLLLDQQFIANTQATGHYSNFFWKVRPSNAESFLFPAIQGNGLFLKLHGSLNWFRCGNHKCPASSSFTFSPHTQGCLSVSEGIGEVTCWQCASEMNPVIIPPLLRKPVTDDPVIRSAWGLAKAKLATASKVVVIGFSAAMTDFYASWLLRSTVGTREGVEVVVINPSNEQGRPDHEDFKRRMQSIFLRGYGSQFYTFSQIEAAMS